MNRFAIVCYRPIQYCNATKCIRSPLYCVNWYVNMYRFLVCLIIPQQYSLISTCACFVYICVKNPAWRSLISLSKVSTQDLVVSSVWPWAVAGLNGLLRLCWKLPDAIQVIACLLASLTCHVQICAYCMNALKVNS